MSKSLEEIRAKLRQLEGKRNSTGSMDKTTYPHWNIPEGTSTILRFLPDANSNNTFFWSERQLFKFPFPGIKGQDENKKVVVQIPCIEMWDGKNSCPILNEVRPWWRDDSLKETASTYWVKRTYYMQGFVKQDPLNEATPPENPIRKFIITPQIFAIIKAALLDPDMEHSPVDYINGTDFIVSKTSKGGFADYGTSKWARKESSLTEEMQDAINQYGLVDLTSYLPKKPTPEQLAIQFEMFQASLDGELYDPDKWGQYYKPSGFDSVFDEEGTEGRKNTFTRQMPVSKPAPAPIVEDDEDDSTTSTTVVEESTEKVETTVSSSAAGKSPQEILAMLRNRNK